MSYTDDAVKAKLSALNETQESIVTVAQWIMFHRRYADRTAQLWLQRIKDAGSHKRLNLVYLANEVVQQSKARKKDDFVVAFSPLIAEATAISFRGATNEVQQKLRRVVEVWRGRQIFDSATQEAIEARVEELEKSRSNPKKGQLGGSLFSHSSSSAPAELQPLVPLQVALTKAEVAAKPAVGTGRTEAGTLAELSAANLAAPVLANRLNTLLKSIVAAETAVKECVKTRADLIAALESLLAKNRAALEADEAQAAGFAGERAAVEARKRDVEDDIQRGLAREPQESQEAGAQGVVDAGAGAPAEPARPEVEELTPPPDEPVARTTTPPEAPPAHLYGYTDGAAPAADSHGYTAAYDAQHARPDVPAGAAAQGANGTLSATVIAPAPALTDPTGPASAAAPAHADTSAAADARASASPRAKRRKLSSHAHHRPGLRDEEFAGFGEGGDALEGLDEDVVGMLG